MAKTPWSVRIYQALLRLFPAEYRGDFGHDMTEDFREQYVDARSLGGGRRVRRLWFHAVADTLRLAPREHLEIVRRDVGYSLRLLRRRPAFAGSALLTLAIGIGLNTAVFSATYGILIRKYPLPEADRLVRLSEVSPAPERELDGVSGLNVFDWKEQSETLDAVALIQWTAATLIGQGIPERLTGMEVSEDFFPMLGVKPALGRAFSPADFAAAPQDVPAGSGQPRPVIVSHALWQGRLGARPDVVGQTVQLDDTLHEVIGVLPPEFDIDAVWNRDKTDYWLTGGINQRHRRSARSLRAIGRLAPSATLSESQAELTVIADRLAATYPETNEGWGAQATPIREAATADVRVQLWFLFGAAALVLLIACANVANLVLAHATGRRTENATRVALGASRMQLVRQSLTEGFVLAGLGGTAGCVLAVCAVPLLVSLAPPNTPRLSEVVVDWHVLAFAVAISVLAGLVSGLAAVASMDQRNLKRSFGLSGARTGGRGRGFRTGLTVVQVALALMLAVAAGLMVRTMQHLSKVDLGFTPTDVLAVGLNPDYGRYGSVAAIHRFEETLVERVEAHPRVVAATIGARPMTGFGVSMMVSTPGQPEELVGMSVDAVNPGYFETLRIQLLKGRFFSRSDTNESPLVALLNASSAQALFGDTDPVGQTVIVNKKPIQIVGVVGDIRRRDLESESGRAIYLPNLQSRNAMMGNLLVRTDSDPRSVIGDIRRIVAELDPDQAVARIETMEERLVDVLAPKRFILRLVGLFSVVALGLAMVGIYGVVAESVAQRVPEIGIRMALGADGAAVVRLILGEGARMVVAGIAIGCVGAIAFRHAMVAFVFGVPTTDVATYTFACLALGVAALVACLLPARRAAGVDPVIALRAE